METSSVMNMAENMIVNPIAPFGADPWVVWHEGGYYYCYSSGDGIVVQHERTLEGVLQPPTGPNWKKQLAEKNMGRQVWAAPPDTAYSKEIWAPELHHIGNQWYIYFAADAGSNETHKMYVLQSENDDPMSEYTFVGKIAATPDKWAIDGTVMQLDGKLYFIWSGWEGDENVVQDLYIARMKSPVEIEGERVKISSPEYDWEKVGEPLVNEGPEVLQHDGKTFIIYSASGSWLDHYCLGQLALVGDDPMDPDSWQKKPEPVFSGTSEVISPGHASFVKSPDGKEDWIVYHTARHAGAGWDRVIRIQSFTWDADGNPVFGEPVASGVPIKAPSSD